MKKRLLALLLAGAMCFSLAACGNDTGDTTSKPPEDTSSNPPESGNGDDAELTINDVWPSGTTVYIDVPAKAGGGTDLYTRYLTQALGEVCPGVNFVVTNYDTTEVGRENAKNADPDGTHFLVHHGGAQIEYMAGTSNVSPKDDYKTVALVNVGGPQVIIAKPDAPFKNLSELGEYIEAHPGELVVGCTLGGASQVMLRGVIEGIKPGLSDQVNWVQCGSEADKLTQTASGSIDMANCSVPNGIAYEADGKLTILGTMAPSIANLENMSELMGEPLPESFKTAAEQGISYNYDSNYYLWAPKDLPDDIAKVINETVNKCVDVQSFIDGNKQMVTYIDKRDYEETQAAFDKEWVTNEEAVKGMGIYAR